MMGNSNECTHSMYFLHGGKKVAKSTCTKIIMEDKWHSTVGKRGKWMHNTLKKHPETSRMTSTPQVKETRV